LEPVLRRLLAEWPQIKAPRLTEIDAVIVRTGSDWGVDNQTWLTIFRNVTDQLADTPGSGTAASG
jgi:hypothetical protein